MNASRSTSEIDVIYFIRILLKWWKRIGIAVGVIALVTAAITMTLPKTYRAIATILPNSESSSEIMRMAAMAGYMSQTSENSSELYPEIMMSTRILTNVIQKKYTAINHPHPIDLIEYWFAGKEDAPRAALLEKTLKKIRQGGITVFKNKQTGIVSVSAITGEPQLSADIVNAMLYELDLYNREYRKIKAKEQRIFIQGRLGDENSALETAENSLRLFRERNRRVIDSPRLLLVQERLLRNLELHSSIFLELNRQYELIKLEEVKNTPVVNILDRAEEPVLRHAPRRKNIVILVTVIAFVLIVFLVIIRDYYMNFLKGMLNEH